MTVELVWNGDLRFTGTAPDNTVLFDSAGKAGVSPVQALVESLGACMGMDLAHFLHKSRVPAEKLKGDNVAQTSGIENLVKGFETAKTNVASKMGVADLERTTATDRSAKFTGNRSPSDVAAYIARKQSMVSLLYEERLKSNPTLEGKVTVLMVIEEDGTVSSVSVLKSESTLDDPDFTAELLRRIKRWIFPPSTGGPVEMKSPFVFRPA